MDHPARVEGLSSVSRVTLASALAALGFILYLAGLVFYRLFLSPLAGFPGPKLTAMTAWYESYFELIKGGGGQFVFQIKRWHDEYGAFPFFITSKSRNRFPDVCRTGPVVRINPHELHIDDPEYWEVVYSASSTFDKMKSTQYRFGAPHATFSTPEHDIHKHRRAALLGHFSKRKITQYAPYIQDHADKICIRLANEYATTGKILRLNDLWACFVSDIITNFSFRQNYGFIDMPDFKSPFTHSIDELQQYAHVGNQFPWMFKIMNRLPDSVVVTLQPMMKSIREFEAVRYDGLN